jgi:hypothetical protein
LRRSGLEKSLGRTAWAEGHETPISTRFPHSRIGPDDVDSWLFVAESWPFSISQLRNRNERVLRRFSIPIAPAKLSDSRR